MKITAKEKRMILRRRIKARDSNFNQIYKKEQIKEAMDIVEDIRTLVRKNNWSLKASKAGRTYLENEEGYKLYFTPLVQRDRRIEKLVV